MTDITQPVLIVENLTKRFGDFKAVDDVSFEVNQGDIFGFLGPNGAGKTTTIRAVLGLLRPTSGTIRLLGHTLGNDYHKAVAKVGSLIDYPAFYGYLTGRANLAAFGKLLGGVSGQRIDEALELVGLSKAGGRPAKVYSQGMRQRLGIALALLRRPQLLILDEPTNGLDPEGQAELLHLLKVLATEQGVTVFVSSHQLDEIERYCTRAGILSQGKLVAIGQVSELIRDRLGSLYIRCSDLQKAEALLSKQPWVSIVEEDPNDGALVTQMEPRHGPDVARLLVEAGIELEEMKWLQVSLRDYFMDLTQKK